MRPAPDQSAADLSTRLRGTVASFLKMDPGDLGDHLELGEDLCMDSLAAAEMLVVIEEDLDTKLPPDFLAGWQRVTYGQLDKLVCDHVAEQR